MSTDPDTDFGDLGATYGAFARDLARVADSRATVLLFGESGSGKSHAARLLHSLGPRAQAPLIEVPLAALPPSLLEAELFGHEEGAFTGAGRDRLGRFRRAEGGTLVLDGVEELPIEMQVKLLRVLQERIVEPLGGDPVPIDARVVATSTRDLEGEMRAGRFREDLYYRLAVVSLRVPPLRARLDDLDRLAHELSSRAAERVGRAVRALGPAALERLRAHPWPGNVRELENALERVMVLGPVDGEVVPEEFAFLGEALDGAPRELARRALALGLDVDGFTLALIEEALAEERGNVAAAARRVGLSRRAFEYRRKKCREPGGGADQEEPAP